MGRLSKFTGKTKDYWLLKEFIEKLMYKQSTISRDKLREVIGKYKAELEGLMECSYKQHPIIAEALWNLEEDKNEHITSDSLLRVMSKLAKKRHIDERKVVPLVNMLVRMT